MAIVAPKERKPLSADALFHVVRSGFAPIPDPRCEAVDISFTDALLSAFAMFALTAPSRLAFDKARAAGNVHPIYGMQRVPCDTDMRERLAPLSPTWLRPVFTSVLRQLQRGKALAAMVCLDGHYVLALDGPGYFSSQTMHWTSCLHRVHRNGSIPSTPHMLGAALLPPDQRTVIPLMPEPIGQHDGTAKNDGERYAATRFVAQWRQEHPHRKCIVTADRLSANAPPIETLHAHALHSILGVKEGDPAALCQQGAAAEHAGQVTSYERHDRAAGVLHRLRFVNDRPRNASTTPGRVHCVAYWDMRHDTGQHFSGVTDLRVNKRNVFHLMRGGRARWKIDNETCNTLKNPGDHVEHTYGHGEQHLSVGFAMVRMRAFWVDHTQQLCWALFRAVWTQLGSKRRLWERLRALL